MHRLRLAAAVACVLALVAVPVHAGTFSIQHSRQGLDGDTYAFRVDPDQEWTIHAGSTISIDATYPKLRDDASVALAFTDLQFQAFESVSYFTVQNGGERHVELLDDTPAGQELHINDPDGPFHTFGGTWFFVDDVTLPGRSWHFAVSAPGAATIDVEVDLNVSEDLAITGEGVAGAGATFAAEDFDGTAQFIGDGRTAAVDVHARAQAPTGTRGFAVMFPFTGSGFGDYGIDGPGRDDARTVLQLDEGPPPAAHVLAGSPGTYDHWVDAEAWRQDSLDGRAAVFFAAPMPL